MLATPNLITLARRRPLMLAFLVLPLIGLLIQPPDSRARLESDHSLNNSKRPESQYVPGEILVRFRQNAAATKTSSKFHLTVLQAQGEISVHVERLAGPEIVEGLRLARVAPDDTWRAIAALRARLDVIYAEPNYILRSRAIPNDPHFPEMSNLKNTGQSGSPGTDIRAEQAWDITTGSDTVVVGVVDTGVDTEHPDLRANIWRNSSEIPDNGVDDDTNGYVDDVSGWDFYNNDKTVFDSPALDAHGTHVAGTIGAVGNNGIGVVGVNWRVKLMPLKFLGSTDGTGTTAGAISALQYARTMRDRGVNIRVLNNSWGGRSFSNALRDAILEVNAAGIIFVAAAGNEGMDNDSFPTYPANYDVPNIISVAAHGNNHDRIPSSNFGAETVDIYAPGFNILSTTPRNYPSPNYTDPDGATYSFRTGTSMATPHVTGTAALVCAARPGILASQLRNSILFGSYIVSSRSTRLETRTYLKANGALQSALENDSVPPGSVTDFRIASRLGRRMDLIWTAAGDDGIGGGPAALYKISFVDSTSGEEIPLLILQPAAPGSSQPESVNMPYQHPAGRMKIVPFDNAGNQGAATTLEVSVDSVVTNVYFPSTGAAEPLSTGGTRPVGLQGDDEIFGNLGLPFTFRFFEQPHGAVSVSTNGALYFTTPPEGIDAFSTVAGLTNHSMIAGLWDDLRTDRRPEDGVFMVQPDPNRVIFRWQGVTFDTPLPGGGTRGEHPVSFEIELQRSGGIVIRYGEGNANVRPIVGISGGEREPYFVGSHSSENALISLTSAPVLRFSSPPCSSSITGLVTNVPANGYSGFVSVHTGPACPWTALSNASWITILFGANSIGSGNVSLQIAPNQSIQSRSGSVTVAGHTFTVNQPGISCSYQLGTTVQSFPSSGGLSGTSVVTTGNCPWTATTSDTWITITFPSSGSGSGGVNFSVAANPNHLPRSGTIRIAGESLTINQAGSHPADDPQFFVRQHYLDFFNRQPDPAGMQFWVNNIINCGTDEECRAVKRIDTSAAFFLSIEFQQTGYLVHRFYRASFGPRPQFSQFQADTQSIGNGVIVGQPGWQLQLESNKVAFANSWVTRPAFASAYDGLNNTAFVNTLIANTGAAFAKADRDGFITALNSSTKTRAQVLRDIAENQAFYNAEFNSAFVQMQYFGYLRRNPQDPPDNNLDGFNFWLNKLNQFGGDFRRAEMVKAFINSGEYRQRFISP